MPNPYDVIVVGAGFAGSILAERLASQRDRRVLLLERRKHLAGNMFDRHDDAGILVHAYGPHIFRTDDKKVWSYLGQFTGWFPYQHRVLASVDGQLVPVPFNLTSVTRLFPEPLARSLTAKLLSRFGENGKVPVADLRAHADPELARLGDYIFERVYLNYTVKAWGERPENLDFATITRRVPVRVGDDDRYFQQKHQGMPLQGYTRMFERMLAHPNIEVRLGVDATRVLQAVPGDGTVLFEGSRFDGPVVYSGAVDELFGFYAGELPYRGLDLVFRTLGQDQFQPVGTVNYPNDPKLTRITEYKHLTGQRVPGVTSISEEYPKAYRRGEGEEPYYPIPKPENDARYARYAAMAARIPNLRLIGRLAEYRYYDMHDIIVRALGLFDELCG